MELSPSPKRTAFKINQYLSSLVTNTEVLNFMKEMDEFKPYFVDTVYDKSALDIILDKDYTNKNSLFKNYKDALIEKDSSIHKKINVLRVELADAITSIEIFDKMMRYSSGPTQSTRQIFVNMIECRSRLKMYEEKFGKI